MSKNLGLLLPKLTEDESYLCYWAYRMYKDKIYVVHKDDKSYKPDLILIKAQDVYDGLGRYDLYNGLRYKVKKYLKEKTNANRSNDS